MQFNSIEFLLFFPTVCAAYFLAPFRYRWVLLLVASYFFYAWWDPRFLVLIGVSTLIDYFAALLMGSVKRRELRTAFLFLSLFSNLGLLFTFKYLGFATELFAGLVGLFGVEYSPPDLGILLPVGISFYTFQKLSYTIEVFRGTHSPERHLGIFALYVSFFPQLVAGPIERSTRLLPQFFNEHSFDYDRIVSGLRLMAWGMFKKVVIADRLSLLVALVYQPDAHGSGPLVVLGTICFAFQIYCDFSGYTDIAIGASRVLGFNLVANFDRPYHARSIPEFWQRWHISLSTWFRDYLYIPLGGNRVRTARWIFNILAVFVVSGLWHGAQWTFVLWGAIHGFFYLLTVAIGNGRKGRKRDERGLRGLPGVAITFTIVCFAWIFFRAETLEHAFDLIHNLGMGWGVLASSTAISPGSPPSRVDSFDR